MDPAVEELVATFIERVEAGERVTPEAFASEHPAHAEALLEVLAQLARTEARFPTMATESRDRIGPYRVVAELGRGGMGRVLKVERDDRPGVHFALKVLSITSAFNSRHLERLEREGAVLERLAHPNIVTVENVGTIDGQPYIAMALVPGPTIADRLAEARSTKGPLPVPGDGDLAGCVALICAKIARAVAAAHEAGLLHRDLKPGNVILPDDAEPVLIDFGLVGGDTGPTLTMTGDVIGTPHYMAPEQALGRAATERTDVYGIGSILYEMLTLSPPHPGNDPLSVVESVKRRPLRSPRRLTASVPRDLETIVLRAMAYVPERRYADATALAADLERFAEGRSILARPPSLVERAAQVARFHRGALVGIVLVLLAAGLIWALTRSDPEAEKARRRAAHEAVAIAWYAGDREALAQATGDLEAIDGETSIVECLWASDGRDPAPEGGVAKTLHDGLTAYREKRYDVAVDHFRDGARVLPDAPLVQVMLGIAARRAKRHDVAIDALNLATNAIAKPGRLLLELAAAYRLSERFDDALGVARRATEALPTDPDAWVELGYIQYLRSIRGMREGERESLDATRRAIELAGDAVTVRQLRARAFALERAKDYRACEEIYRRILKQRPDSVQDLYLLAWAMDHGHKGVEARDTYRAVLQKNPRHVSAASQLAFLHAGAHSTTGCAECKALYEAHPELLDFPEAQRLVRTALEIDRGRSRQPVEVAASVVKLTGFPQDLIDLFQTCKREAYREKKLERAALLDKFLWEIDSAR